MSATLAHPAWNNSTALKGDVVNEVPALKQHIDGNIVIAGSLHLVRMLIEHDLVDELRLKIFPAAPTLARKLQDYLRRRHAHCHPDVLPADRRERARLRRGRQRRWGRPEPKAA